MIGQGSRFAIFCIRRSASWVRTLTFRRYHPRPRDSFPNAVPFDRLSDGASGRKGSVKNWRSGSNRPLIVSWEERSLVEGADQPSVGQFERQRNSDHRLAIPLPLPVSQRRPEPSCATSDFPACWRSARRKPFRRDSSECKWLSRPCVRARLSFPRVRRTSVPRNRRAQSICDDRHRPSDIELVLLARRGVNVSHRVGHYRDTYACTREIRS